MNGTMNANHSNNSLKESFCKVTDEIVLMNSISYLTYEKSNRLIIRNFKLQTSINYREK